MTISLVSAPIVGFDLVRHPRGRAVADLLLWGLTIRPADLAVFDEVAAAAATDAAATEARSAGWAEVRATQQRLGAGVLHGTALTPAAGALGGGSGAPGIGSMLESLRNSLIMDLDDLEHLIRNDILNPRYLGAPEGADATTAADVLLDAVVAEWVDGLDAGTRSALRAAYVAVRTRLGSAGVDVGPCAGQVHGVLDRLRRFSPDDCARLRMINDLLGSGGSAWAEAVHEASWAALTTDRIRSAAAAQLLTVEAFVDSGLTPADGAEGVWNLVSGHVHAGVVADVLPAATQELLGKGWRAAQPD